MLLSNLALMLMILATLNPHVRAGLTAAQITGRLPKSISPKLTANNPDRNSQLLSLHGVASNTTNAVTA
jgi:hypothetical protein